MNKEMTLTSLAMLKVSIDSGKDYLEYLKPFVIQALAHGKLEIVSDKIVADKLQEECGLIIPHRTIQIVLRRLVKAGYLKKDQGIYHVVKELSTKDYSKDKANASRNISAVTNSLIEFAAQSAEKDINEEDAIEALIVFLSEFSIPCLKAYLRGTALPNIAHNNTNWKIVLVSQYLSKIHASDPQGFNGFIMLVQGHMLANALLCPDLQSVSKTYKGVTFYLDTQLLLQLLGLEGKAKQEAVNELLGLIQKLDGKIAAFSHTHDELISVINASSNYIDSPKGRGSIVYEARQSGKTKSDMLLIAGQAQEIMESVGVIVKPTPAYNLKLQIDETAFSDILSDEVSYYSPRAREFDINSVRSIYVLRGNTCPYSVENSKAIFVTSNAGFSRAAYEYGKNIDQSRAVSTVITDFSLANTAWLKAPQGAPTLPQKEVIAFAYAALRPSDDFLEKMLSEAERLEKQGKISARDHQLLRSSPYAQNELMSLTLGEDEALTERSFTTTLSRVSAEIKKEEAEKLTEEQVAHRETQEKLFHELNKNQVIQQKIYWVSVKRARIISCAVFSMIVILVILGIVAGLISRPINPIISWSLTTGLSVVALLTLLNLVFGTTVRRIYKWFYEKLQILFYHRSAKALGIELDGRQQETDSSA